MASLKEAKQNLIKSSSDPKKIESLDEAKLKLLKLDLELSLPKIANEIDTLEYTKVFKSFFLWSVSDFIKSKFKSNFTPYIPFILSLLLIRKNK